jgi:diketogulonate reductase-like aldo/keto reductase
VQHELVGGATLPKIGFGTWKIGGGYSPDRAHDPESLNALRSALALGYRHFDTAEMYADGHAEELLGRAIREVDIPREDLFITTKVLPEHLAYQPLLNACEGSLRRLGLEYVDLYLIHWPNPGSPLSESFRALNKLVERGQARYVGVSNFDRPLLKEAERLSEAPLLTNQVPYSLSDRTYVKNGVVDYCQRQGILITAYSPVAEGKLPASKALAAIAREHAASPYQIALAWLATQRCVIAIPMSQNVRHQKENLLAGDIQLAPDEMANLH